MLDGGDAAFGGRTLLRDLDRSRVLDFEREARSRSSGLRDIPDFGQMTREEEDFASKLEMEEDYKKRKFAYSFGGLCGCSAGLVHAASRRRLRRLVGFRQPCWGQVIGTSPVRCAIDRYLGLDCKQAGELEG